LIVAFIDEQRVGGRGVESICRSLRMLGLPVAPRTYRAWKTRSPSVRTVNDARVLDTLRQLRTGSATGGPLPEVLYGRRKMTAWLVRNGHPGISKHTVDRLMRQERMRGLVRGRRTRTTIAGKDGRRAQDLLNRQFRTTAPNRAWVTDFTYCSTWSGYVYVAFAIDLYSRAIVGWSASTTKDTAFVEACLAMALWRRDHTGRPVPAGMIHHSDAGSIGVHPLHRNPRPGGVIGLDRDGGRCLRRRRGVGVRAIQERSHRGRLPVPHRPAAHLDRHREDHHRLRRLVQQPPPAQPAKQRHTRGVRAGLLRSPNRLTKPAHQTGDAANKKTA
jgi:hypothetical protein